MTRRQNETRSRKLCPGPGARTTVPEFEGFSGHENLPGPSSPHTLGGGECTLCRESIRAVGPSFMRISSLRERRDGALLGGRSLGRAGAHGNPLRISPMAVRSVCRYLRAIPLLKQTFPGVSELTTKSTHTTPPLTSNGAPGVTRIASVWSLFPVSDLPDLAPECANPSPRQQYHEQQWEHQTSEDSLPQVSVPTVGKNRCHRKLTTDESE